ncbi:hypothetical protein SAMN05421858_3116 [Haladaptatus litoreus]|uniref:Uncharacterized protein n=1 Tax=Haladaptatus litoreus TaxID=553468 RepID=A0A1N7CMS6_9EURY|nr:hypothetical protein SAMN05421858_3116 [Haladaptatus litoreus]
MNSFTDDWKILAMRATEHNGMKSLRSVMEMNYNYPTMMT